MHFAPGELPEVKAFWSMSIYDMTFNFSANPIDRSSIGDRTPGLVRDANGGLTLYLQSSDPGGEKSANWLPTQAGNPFFFILRGHEPTGTFAAMTWPGPKVSRI